jgi:HAD superfamily hydrolase (TIGR01509 family)
MNTSTRTRPATLPRIIDAAIFDFDETLIDLEPQHTYAALELCRVMKSDYGAMPEEFRKGSGRRIIDDILEMRAVYGWSQSVEELFEVRQRFFETACRESALTLMEGAEALVRALSDRGITLAVTSSAVRGPIVEILERFDLLERFALIVDGSEVARGKPDPEAYVVTAQKLTVQPDRCIVFEDSNVGVLAAKAARMFCIAVPNRNAQIVQDVSSADLVLESLAEFDAGWVAAK